MPNKQEQRDELYKTSSEDIQNLYSSEAVGDAIRKTFNELGLPKEKYGDYVHIFGDAFLGIEKPESVYSALMLRYDLSSRTAVEIIKAVASNIDSAIFVITTPNIDGNTPLAAVQTTHTESPSISSTTSPASATHQPTPSSPIPAMRVMPQNAAELPNALLQNLKASLAHSEPLTPYVEQPTPKAAYNSLLETQTPNIPTTPTS